MRDGWLMVGGGGGGGGLIGLWKAAGRGRGEGIVLGWSPPLVCPLCVGVRNIKQRSLKRANERAAGVTQEIEIGIEEGVYFARPFACVGLVSVEEAGLRVSLPLRPEPP